MNEWMPSRTASSRYIQRCEPLTTDAQSQRDEYQLQHSQSVMHRRQVARWPSVWVKKANCSRWKCVLNAATVWIWFVRFILRSRSGREYSIILRPCQHDDGYRRSVTDKIHTDERTQVHSAQSSLTVTHPSTNRSRRDLTSVNVPLN